MPSLSRCLMVVGLVAAASVSPVTAAHASCVGPMMTATLNAQGRILVEGEYFGTTCNDAGQVPEDEVLGAPAADITVLVRQGQEEWPVALGNANPDYGFAVEVDSPSIEGVVSVEARHGVPSELLATAELDLPGPVNPESGVVIASFGTLSSSLEGIDTGSRDVFAPVAVGILAVSGAIALVVHGWLRRRRTAHM